MTRKRAPSKSTCKVLSELLVQPQYGYALMKLTLLKSGTLYPILMRLSDRGLLETSWEDPETLGRPRRQIYKLTKNGRAFAIKATSQNDHMAPSCLD